jgi:hypothetical protein
MHRSRLCQLVIDCPAATMAAAVPFWSGALGVAPQAPVHDGRYVELKGDVLIGPLLQRVDEPAAFHVDIETDDVDAEVARLEQLGARRIRQVKTWWVMEAPTGHRFCVVRPQTPDFADKAHVWE